MLEFRGKIQVYAISLLPSWHIIDVQQKGILRKYIGNDICIFKRESCIFLPK